MTMRRLIDARHPEETRVAVVKGNRIEEFDFESAEHKQLKGNIYLAKVTRVEPSLQAAFVDYGGNRHGFLAFSEIHPDYYQIPKEDREALLREEAEHAEEEARLRAAEYDAEESSAVEEAAEALEAQSSDAGAESAEDEDGELAPAEETGAGADESAAENLRRKRQALRRRYKIQDVIRRRQVLLVQVVKEERGNKGAALTTYLSLAGRYCVLMPNTSHGGGISRKISNGADRKRLKAIMADLNLPTSMGLIVRTAGLSRTKTEIKRDFDYLARLWDEIRDRTLKSSAPALIYQDSDLIKRAIRDIYSREIDEVIVEGEEGYRDARGFMKLLMPSHVRRVRNYADPVPLFQRHGVEDQLSAMYQPVVQLKSGGYIVINPTEALVSIDINSGRSTREHNIEQTAFQTNLEAASEIARQLRLRDMAGLVVIDFIDMEQSGHVRKVEKAMKEALKNDRARIQVGRISSFGLMEMSRQRLRTGVLEASTKPCVHCEGTGLMRTASSAGLSALRMLEDEAARGRGSRIVLRAGREAAIYLLNRKRGEIAEIEERYGVGVEVLIEDSFEGARMAVESLGPPPERRYIPPPPVQALEEDQEPEIEEIEDEDIEAEDDGEAAEAAEVGRPEREEGREGRRRRRRRGRRGGRRREGRPEDEDTGDRAQDPESREAGGVSVSVESDAEPEAEPELPVPEPVEAAAPQDQSAPEQAADGEEQPKKARRRPRARKKADEAGPSVVPSPEAGAAPTAEPDSSVTNQPATEPEPEPEPDAPKRRRGGRRKKADAVPEAVAESGADETAVPQPAAQSEPQLAQAEQAADEPELATEAPAAANDAEPGEAAAAPDAGPAQPPRRGWWQRTFGG